MKKIMINTEVLKKICGRSFFIFKNKYSNLLKCYKYFEGDLEQFLDYKNNNKKYHYFDEDKIFIAIKLLEKADKYLDLQVLHDIAYSVLYIFEEKYPDKAPRELLKSLQNYIDEKGVIDEYYFDLISSTLAHPVCACVHAAARRPNYYWEDIEGYIHTVYCTAKKSVYNKNLKENIIQIIKNVYNGVKNQ